MSRFDQPKPVVKEFHDPLACEWDLALHWNFTSDGPLNVPAGIDDEDAGVKIGRHEILIRPNPSPDPRQLVVSQSLLRLLQENERLRLLAQEDGRLASLPPRRVIVITPTYKRTFQQLLMLGLINSLKRVQAPLLWVVVEATKTEETARLIAKATIGDSGAENPEVEIAHLSVEEEMAEDWDKRVLLEQRMRVVGLRYVREHRLDGIVVFADDSSVFSPKFFAEAQRVPWFGAGSVGVLLPVGFPQLFGSEEQAEEQSSQGEGLGRRSRKSKRRGHGRGRRITSTDSNEGDSNDGTGGGSGDGAAAAAGGGSGVRITEAAATAGMGLAVGGGAAESGGGGEAGKETGAAAGAGGGAGGGEGGGARGEERKEQEAAKLVLSAGGGDRGEELPDWVRGWEEWGPELERGLERGSKGGPEEDLETGSVAGSGAEGRLFDLLAAVVRDEREVRLIGQCGRRVLVWWWRAEARQDSKFPAEWVISPQLPITVGESQLMGYESGSGVKLVRCSSADVLSTLDGEIQ
ncbi:unnamed protein product [Closterium sp. Yama58-4]|nr:unnamed protein product [Closterium sp. Yama58-4]